MTKARWSRPVDLSISKGRPSSFDAGRPGGQDAFLRIEGLKTSVSNRRSTRLDALEARLTGPKRIALFGHRNVGKTTLLAMFYRQAAGGQVPGVRLAAADAPSAEYLAEKIAQIESGQATAGTLAETELNLRLYHGPARFELIVKDYQGEHVTLGTDEPIQEFFAGCDAVLLCLDPEGSTDPAERRRRQQEIEGLLERYIERSEDLSTDRPVALLLTKFDRVLARQGAAAAPQAGSPFSEAFVEKLVDEQYGMTRHALRQHAPDGVIFAVSSFGRGRPATGLRPRSTRWASKAPWAGSPSSLRPATAPRWSGSGTSRPTTCPGSTAASPHTRNATPGRTGPTSSATAC